MRISFLSPFYPYRGGIAQFSDSLYLVLKKKNEVSAINYKRLYPEIFFPGRTQYVSPDDKNRNVNSKKILDSINPLSYKRTVKEIINFESEILITSYWMPFFSLSLGYISGKVQRSGIKTISILHNVIPHEKRAGDILLTKYFFNKCNGFVILNENSIQDLISVKPDAKYIALEHPVYEHYGERIEITEARNKLRISMQKKIILFFGFIRDYKGLDILISSLKYLNEDIHLLVAGEVYGSFEKYQRLINENSLQGRMNLFIQYIPENQIPLFFSAADLCVLPYKSATQSGITGIAYHFDLPVVVTDVGGLKETVEDGITGLIVYKPDPKQIAEKINYYFRSNLKPTFQKNISVIKNKNSWQSFADSIIEFATSIR